MDLHPIHNTHWNVSLAPTCEELRRDIAAAKEEITWLKNEIRLATNPEEMKKLNRIRRELQWSHLYRYSLLKGIS